MWLEEKTQDLGYTFPPGRPFVAVTGFYVPVLNAGLRKARGEPAVLRQELVLIGQDVEPSHLLIHAGP